MIRGAVLPLPRLDRSRFHEDLALLAELGAGALRITLDWAWLQPAAGSLNGDAAEWYLGALQAARGIGLPLWLTLLDGTVPRWFDNEGGFTDARFAGHWWPRWVEVAADTFGDLTSGWVPIEHPLRIANQLVPDDPRRHGEVIDTLLVGWRDAWRLLRGGPPVATALGVAAVRPADQTIQAAAAARREDHLRWRTWLHALADGTISIPGRADRQLADLAGACDAIGLLVTNPDEALGAMHRAAEMGPPRPLAITLITSPGRDADRVTAVQRFVAAVEEGAEGAPLVAAHLAPLFDTDASDDGVITRDREPKDSAVTFFGR